MGQNDTQPPALSSLSPAEQQLEAIQAKNAGMTPDAFYTKVSQEGQATGNNYPSYLNSLISQNPTSGVAAKAAEVMADNFTGWATTGSANNAANDPTAGGNRSDNQNSSAIGNVLEEPAAINAIDASSQSDPTMAMSDLTGVSANPTTGWNGFMNKATTIGTIAGLGALAGPLAGEAVAGLGATGAGASIGAGALAGAGTGAFGAELTGSNVGHGALVGGLTGGLVGAAKPVSDAIGDAAYNIDPGAISNQTADAIGGGIVKGGIGAGMGALSADLRGGDVSNGALAGGLTGVTSGLVGGYTDNPALGTASGTIASTLANKYLNGQPSTPVPGASSVQTPKGPVNTTPTADVLNAGGPQSAYANIGAYSGYAPQTQVNPNINYETYGQGPEASFFQPVGQTAPQPTAPPGPPPKANILPITGPDPTKQ